MVKTLSQAEIRRRLPTPMQIVPVRLPTSLTKRLDRYAAKRCADQPGARFTRSDAIRVLLERALAEEERHG